VINPLRQYSRGIPEDDFAVLFDHERDYIVSSGHYNDVKQLADHYNEIYQSTAYSAKRWNEKKD